MKYLLYYNLDSKFVTDQTNAGGDGTNVVSVVDGVAWTEDQEKTYYRYSIKPEDITAFTVTIYYKFTINGITFDIAPSEILTVDVYKNKSASLCLIAKNIEGYSPTVNDTTILVNSNTAYTFEYDYTASTRSYLKLEYIEYTGTTESLTGGCLDTGKVLKNLSPRDSLKVAFSYYMPNIPYTGEDSTLIYSDAVSFTEQTYRTGNYIGRPRFRVDRRNTGTSSASSIIMEWKGFPTADSGKGINACICVMLDSAAYWGSYLPVPLTNLNSPKNNYPYESLDNLIPLELPRFESAQTQNGQYFQESLKFFYRYIPGGTRLYGFKAWKRYSGGLVLDIIPALRLPDGVVGILDKVSGDFITGENYTGG